MNEIEKIKINYILEKLSGADIEVITDKSKFDNILKNEKNIQKMSEDLLEIEKLSKQLNEESKKTKNLENTVKQNESNNQLQNYNDFMEYLKSVKDYIPEEKEFSKKLKVIPGTSFYSKLSNIIPINFNNSNEADLWLVKSDTNNNNIYFTSNHYTGLYDVNDFNKVKDFFNDNKILFTFKTSLKSFLENKITSEQQLQNKFITSLNNLERQKNLNNKDIESDFKELDNSLRFNRNFEIESTKLKDNVSVFPGSIGKCGFGIRHIIEERYLKDNLSQDEISALCGLILETVKNGEITRDSDNRCEFSKNGIIAIVRKDFDDQKENWILTGFHYKGTDKEKNREATEAIKTVIAKYSNSDGYSYFRNQVGAVIASLNLNIPQSETKSSPQTMVQNSNTYGFAYEGKIYLNPEIMNSEVPLHEYTHLWDAYTQKTNPELWQKGKEIFKKTYLWDEVKNDPNYSEIKDNDDLVLSEAHARICGKMADAILTKIAERDGELTKDTVIDWNKEVDQYIYETFESSRTTSDGRTIKSKGYGAFGSVVDVNTVRDFFAQPMKDLMNGIKITQNLDSNSFIQKYTSSEKGDKSMAYNDITKNDIEFLKKLGCSIEKNNLETLSFIKNYFLPEKNKSPLDEKHLYTMLVMEGFNNPTSKNHSQLAEKLCGLYQNSDSQKKCLNSRLLILGYINENIKNQKLSNEERIKNLEAIKEKLLNQKKGFLQLIQNDGISKEYKKIIIERALKYNLSEPQKQSVINMAYEKAPSYVSQNINIRTNGRVR